MGALVGEPVSQTQSFRCDAEGGWGAAGAVVAVRPAAMAAVAAEPPDVAPLRPSAAERATGCGRNATTGEVAAACAVIVVHKEPVYWAADLPMPVLPYRRHVTADGLYVVAMAVCSSTCRASPPSTTSPSASFLDPCSTEIVEVTGSTGRTRPRDTAEQLGAIVLIHRGSKNVAQHGCGA